jgi:hypothetical protein
VLYQPLDPVAARRKAALLQECYPSQSGRDWFDDETFRGLMRVRGVQRRARYAETFALEKATADLVKPPAPCHCPNGFRRAEQPGGINARAGNRH